MGVDYDAKAGYGVEVDGNLTVKGQALRDRYDDVYEFIENELPDINYESIGNCYSSNIEYILRSEQADVLNYPDEFKAFKKNLKRYKDILIDIEPKWYCELYIS